MRGFTVKAIDVTSPDNVPVPDGMIDVSAPGTPPVKRKRVDVVFVHGLTGSPGQTWSNRGPRYQEWLRTWLGRPPAVDWTAELAEELKDIATIWRAGYPAPLLEAAHGGEVNKLFADEGVAALDQLIAAGLGKQATIFVAHSLGGLLVKAILYGAYENEQGTPEGALLKKTHAVIFLGTPHAGSYKVWLRHAIPQAVKVAAAAVAALIGWLIAPLAEAKAFTVDIPFLQASPTVGTVVPWATSALLLVCLTWWLQPSRHVQLLDPANPELRRLASQFRVVRRKVPLAVYAFWETRPMRMLGRLVPWWSADPGLTDCEPTEIQASHTEMCKWPYVVSAKRQITLEVKRAAELIPLFGEDIRPKLEPPPELKPYVDQLIDGKSLLEIPTSAEHKPRKPRSATERFLRTRLRELIGNPLHPEGWKPASDRLERASQSAYDLDRLVLALWHEAVLQATLSTMRNIAATQVEGWPTSQPLVRWPSLIPFYRALRAVEHAYVGDFKPEDANDGVPDYRAALLPLVATCYSRLEELHGVPGPAPDGLGLPDGDGSTRSLLARLLCVLKASATASEFIGPRPVRPDGDEAVEDRHARLTQLRQFAEAHAALRDTFKLSKDAELDTLLGKFQA